MSAFPAAAQPTAEMNVTPMIDVLLVVLIIYMLSTMPRHHIPAGLPEPVAAGDRAPVPLPQLVLELEAGGGFTLNSQPVPAAQLRKTLQAVYAGRHASLLFIRSAPERTYQDVVSAMDVARDAGVQVLALMP